MYGFSTISRVDLLKKKKKMKKKDAKKIKRDAKIKILKLARITGNL